MKTTVRDGLTLMRPWHACKNLLIFLPLFFHGGIFPAPEKMAAAAIGFAAFSLSASAIYALNDCRDAPRDKAASAQKNRPVAAGRISEKGGADDGAGAGGALGGDIAGRPRDDRAVRAAAPRWRRIC